jgi:DNA-binding CsgD family transcriptional regulator
MRWGLGPEEVEQALLFHKIAELGCQADDPSFRTLFASRFLPDAPPQMVDAHHALWRATYSPATIVRYMQMGDQIDIRSLAPRVSCPSLVLHARHERAIPFEEGKLLASLLPGSRFVPLPSRNHFLSEDEPAWSQLVNEVRAFLPGAPAAGDPFGDLTPRERELLGFLARGLDNHQIAAHLELSEKTVRNMVSSVFGKLGVESRAQAIVRAREAGYGVDSHA